MKGVADRPAGASLDPFEIAARSGSNFSAGFVCLDRERRTGMTSIYAFCRVVDDAVDEAPAAATAQAHVQFWRAELELVERDCPTTPVGQALQAALRRHGGSTAPLHELLDGVTMDIEPRGCADEAELRLYCHRVASAVGLACLPVLGANSEGARAFASQLGQALQLTNILRDLRPDAEAGRVYVPRTWLVEHAIDVAWLSGRGGAEVYAPAGRMDALCRRLAAAARAEFVRTHATLRSLPRRERRALVPARIMGRIYGTLLRRLERRRGELRGGRVRVPRWQKLWLALSVLAGMAA